MAVQEAISSIVRPQPMQSAPSCDSWQILRQGEGTILGKRKAFSERFDMV
jgi:hypothetical protein